MPSDPLDNEIEYYYIGKDGKKYGPYESKEDAAELGPFDEEVFNS